MVEVGTLACWTRDKLNKVLVLAPLADFLKATCSPPTIVPSTFVSFPFRESRTFKYEYQNQVATLGNGILG